jgi:predicted aldo/keto reductase-like oxidoreductase
MNSPEQLEENLGLADQAMPGMLGKGEALALGRALAAFQETYKIPCTGCNYCMPCPKGINIPGCFTAYNSSFSVGRLAGMSAYGTSSGAISGTPHFATDCVKCGKCESRCPQHIEIIEGLESVARRLEPFYFRPALKLAARIMRG